MDGEVKIVDEFTGRILEGRRWSDGLHQAVEAKERVAHQGGEPHVGHRHPAELLPHVREAGGHDRYGRDRGRRVRQHLQPAGRARSRRTGRWCATTSPTSSTRPRRRKFDAVVEDLVERYEKGQPVLVGTASVEKSEVLSRAAREARHPARGAQRQAAHARGARSSPRPAGSTPSPSPPTWPVAASTSSSAATPKAWRARRSSAEGLDPDSEEGKAEFEELLPGIEAQCKAEGDKVRELGGLYVLGTERHESRRIDNQLRGRSGRQGDPGESRFYLSLEDELMRLFATGAMNWVMGKALPDDVPIEAKMVTKAIERAQNTVEARNAEIRKNVLKYDEVMNEQRKVDLRAGACRSSTAPTSATRRWRSSTRRSDGRRRVLRRRVRRGLGPRGAAARDHRLLPDEVHRRRARPGGHARGALREPDGRGHRVLRAARAEQSRRRDDARDRAPGDAADHRPALARAPLRDGLPPRGHPPAGHGPEGPAGRVAARGLRHVRPDDGRHRRRLRRGTSCTSRSCIEAAEQPSRARPACSTSPPRTRCRRRRHRWRRAIAAAPQARRMATAPRGEPARPAWRRPERHADARS